MAEVKLVVKQIDQGSKGIKDNEAQLKNLVKTAGVAAAGLVALGVAAKQAFDLSREGASLNQLTQSFQRMNETVFMTPDLLDRMSEAARGTIKETDLMAGLLKLTAGASDELAQKMASAAPRLLEIAKASNALNPSLGDTAFLYDSISTGIKRSSPLILDNLGIVVKVGEANERYAAELGKTVEALTAEEKQMALLNETLRAGGKLIDQVGGDLDTQADSWDRLTVRIAESTDAGKRFIADVLNPLIDALAEPDTTPLNDRITTEGLAAQARDFEHFVELLKEFNIHTFDNQTTRAWYDQGVAIEQTAGAQEQFNEQMERTAQLSGADNIARLADMEREAAHQTEELAGASAQLNEQMERTTFLAGREAEVMAELAAQEAAAVAANAALVGAFRDTDDVYGDLLTAQEALSGAQGEWVQTTLDNSGAIAGINAELASDLTGEQAAAMREILNTVDEGSAEWLNAYTALQGDLTKSQREALIAQRADLEAATGTVGSVYTGSIQDAEAAQEAIDAANQAIIDSYRELAIEGSLALAELSPDPEALQRTLDYAVAIGEMTQAEADLRLEAAQTRLAIEALNEKVVAGDISAEGAAIAFDLLTAGEKRTAEAAIAAAEKQQQLNDLIAAMPEDAETKIQILTGDASGRLAGIIQQLDSIGGRNVSANVTVNTNTNIPEELGGGNESTAKPGGGKAFGGPVFANQAVQVGEGNQPELFRQGGKLFLIPGDQGQVFSNSQSKESMGSTSINAPITINLAGGGNPEDVASAVQAALLRTMRQIGVT